MTELQLTPDQVGNLASAFIAAHGRDDWYRCTYNGEALQVPDDLAPLVEAIDPDVVSLADLLAYARTLRDQREAAGTMVGAYPIRTDRETRSALLEALTMTQVEPGWSTPWALSDGQTLTIDADLLAVVIPAVGNHRRSAFALYDAVKAQIEAGGITTMGQVVAAFAAG